MVFSCGPAVSPCLQGCRPGAQWIRLAVVPGCPAAAAAAARPLHLARPRRRGDGAGGLVPVVLISAGGTEWGGEGFPGATLPSSRRRASRRRQPARVVSGPRAPPQPEPGLPAARSCQCQDTCLESFFIREPAVARGRAGRRRRRRDHRPPAGKHGTRPVRLLR